MPPKKASPKTSKASSQSPSPKASKASSKASSKPSSKAKSQSPGPPSKGSSKASKKPSSKKSAASAASSPKSKASASSAKGSDGNASAKGSSKPPKKPKSKSSTKPAVKDDEDAPSPVPSEPDLQPAADAVDAVPPPELPPSAAPTSTSTASTEKARKMLVKELVLKSNREVDECTQALNDAEWDPVKAADLLNTGVLTPEQREVELTKLIRFLHKYKPGSATRTEATKTLELYDNNARKMWDQLTGVYGPIPSEPIGSPTASVAGTAAGMPPSPVLQDGLPPPPLHDGNTSKQSLIHAHSFRAATLARKEHGSPDMGPALARRAGSVAGSGVGIPPGMRFGSPVGDAVYSPHALPGVSSRGADPGQFQPHALPGMGMGASLDKAGGQGNPVEQLLSVLQQSPWLLPGLLGAARQDVAKGPRDASSRHAPTTTDTTSSTDEDSYSRSSYDESTDVDGSTMAHSSRRDAPIRRPTRRRSQEREGDTKVDFPPPPARMNVSFEQPPRSPGARERGGGRGAQTVQRAVSGSSIKTPGKGRSVSGGGEELEHVILDKIRRIEDALQLGSTERSSSTPATATTVGARGTLLPSQGSPRLREPDLLLPDLPPPPPPIPDTPTHVHPRGHVVPAPDRGTPPPPPIIPSQAEDLQRQTEAIRARTRAAAELTRKLRVRNASQEPDARDADALLAPVAQPPIPPGTGPPYAHREAADQPLRAGLPTPAGLPPPPPPPPLDPPSPPPPPPGPPPPLGHGSTDRENGAPAAPNAALGGLLSTLAGAVPALPLYEETGGGMYTELLERQRALLAKQQETQERAKVRVLEQELEKMQKKYEEAQHKQLDQLEVIKKIQEQVACNDAVTQRSVANLGALSEGVQEWAGEVHAQQKRYFDDMQERLQGQASQHAVQVKAAHEAAVQKGKLDMAHLTKLAGEQRDLVQRAKQLAAERVASSPSADPLHEQEMAEKMQTLQHALQASQGRQHEYEKQLRDLTSVIAKSAGTGIGTARALPTADRPAAPVANPYADPRTQTWVDNTSCGTTTLPPAPTPIPESLVMAARVAGPPPPALAYAECVGLDSEVPPPPIVPHHDVPAPGAVGNPYARWGQQAVPVLVAPQPPLPPPPPPPPPPPVAAQTSAPTPHTATSSTPWEEERSEASGTEGQEAVMGELANLREVLRLLVYHQAEQSEKQDEMASKQQDLLRRQAEQHGAQDDIARNQALLLEKQRLRELREAKEGHDLLASLRDMVGREQQPPAPATTPALPLPAAGTPGFVGPPSAPPSKRKPSTAHRYPVPDRDRDRGYASSAESIPGLPSHVLGDGAPPRTLQPRQSGNTVGAAAPSPPPPPPHVHVNVISAGRERSPKRRGRSGSRTGQRTPGAVAPGGRGTSPHIKGMRTPRAARRDSPALQLVEQALRETTPRARGSPRSLRLRQSLDTLSGAVAHLKRSASRGPSAPTQQETATVSSPLDVTGYRPPPTPPSVNPHRAVLEQFYTRHDPSKLRDIDMILDKFAGHENTLFHSLAKKYNVKLNPHREQLIAFYAKHNPVKLCEVDVILHLAEGYEEKLMKKLADKYMK